MKRNRLISITLITFILLVCQVFALKQPSFKFEEATGLVAMTGQTTPLADVNIVVAKEGKRYFLDSIKADDKGNYTFTTKLPKDKVFEVLLSSQDEVLPFKVETKEENKPGPGPNPKDDYVTFSVDKKTIGKGYVIAPTEAPFTQGETVWDIFQRELNKRGIDYDYTFRSEYDSVYIESIDGDGEFDHGPDSGWMYEVNDDYPKYGASLYKIKSGDVIKWRYTTNLGNDLGGNTATGGGGGGGLDNSIKVPNVTEAVVSIPKEDGKVFYIHLTKELDRLQVLNVNVPESNSKVFLEAKAMGAKLPAIRVARGLFILNIDKDTQLVSGPTQIGLFNAKTKDSLDQALKVQITKKVFKDVAYYKMNATGEKTIFSKPISMRLAKGKSLKAAFIVGKEFMEIPIFANQEAAQKESVKGENIYYAYQDGEDLVIYTNSLSSFMIYTQSDKDLPSIEIYQDEKSISKWAREEINLATQKGLIQGNKGNFRPQEPITRAAFTKILLHMVYGEEISSQKTAPFSDIKANSWYKDYVDMAYEKGIIEGDDKYFRPDEKINREQMAVMLVRALKLEGKEEELPFKDAKSLSEWAQKEAAIAYQHGLIQGTEDSFMPKEEATREMAVVVAMRGYRLHQAK